MNICIFSGRASADAEVKVTQSGKKVARVRLAVDGIGKDAKAQFFDLIMWEGRADVAERFIQKGKEISVRAHANTRSYEAQDGSKRYVTEYIVDELKLHGAKPAEKQSNGGNEEIPF